MLMVKPSESWRPITMTPFKLTARQLSVQSVLAGPAKHQMLFGGSRSGKTFLLTRNVVMRALKAPGSRHAIFRFRFNHLKSSIIADTFPKVMALAFPGVRYGMNKTDWFATLGDGAEIWFGGLDDKERTDKILGQEHATIYLNECSQIGFDARNSAMTRLAQRVTQKIDGRPETLLRPRMYYDCNPVSKAHWAYRLFVEKRNPDTKEPTPDPENYVWAQMNPGENLENLADGYLDTLRGMSARHRKRFLEGEWADATPNALFSELDIDKWRVMDGSVPDMVRIVVGVDPSGSGDKDNADNDAIGIVVGGLGIDGNAYLLEDCTVKAGPKVWGDISASAYDRHRADCIVGESNFGGDMVRYVIQTARPRTPYRAVTASRGKAIRAEPFSALYEQGKVRHVGYFADLEDELCAFSTTGYLGANSPNRADAWIWVLTELFPGMVKAPAKKEQKTTPARTRSGWMAA